MTSGIDPLTGEDRVLTSAEIRRYARHLTLPGVGMPGQSKLLSARVLVIGAGGLGSPVLQYLCAAGVGTIGIVDGDVVEESNLQRQNIHTAADVGRLKVESAAERLRALNPEVHIDVYPMLFNAQNGLKLVKNYDLVIDGSDNFSTRYLVSDVCELVGKPSIWGSIIRFEGQVAVFFAKASNAERAVTLRDLYPQAPPPGTVPSCSEAGVFGSLCGIIGSMMATEAIKLITGVGESLLGRVLFYNAADITSTIYRIVPDAERPHITEVSELDMMSTNSESCPPQPILSSDVQEVSALELSTALSGDNAPVLIDVREPYEWDIVRIDGAQLLPLSDIEKGAIPSDVPKEQNIVLFCRGGVRSQSAARILEQRGFSRLLSLRGGILDWIKDVDPSLPSY